MCLVSVDCRSALRLYLARTEHLEPSPTVLSPVPHILLQLPSLGYLVTSSQPPRTTPLALLMLIFTADPSSARLSVESISAPSLAGPRATFSPTLIRTTGGALFSKPSRYLGWRPSAGPLTCSRKSGRSSPIRQISTRTMTGSRPFRLRRLSQEAAKLSFSSSTAPSCQDPFRSHTALHVTQTAGLSRHAIGPQLGQDIRPRLPLRAMRATIITHARWAIDSGCAPHHMALLMYALGMLELVDLDIITALHPTPTSSKVHRGQGMVPTICSAGIPRNLLLPGTTIFSANLPTNLASYHTLLVHGFQLNLALDGGYVGTPDGLLIMLDAEDGMWYFPEAYQPCTQLPQRVQQTAAPALTRSVVSLAPPFTPAATVYFAEEDASTEVLSSALSPVPGGALCVPVSPPATDTAPSIDAPGPADWLGLGNPPLTAPPPVVALRTPPRPPSSEVPSVTVTTSLFPSVPRFPGPKVQTPRDFHANIRQPLRDDLVVLDAFYAFHNSPPRARFHKLLLALHETDPRRASNRSFKKWCQIRPKSAPQPTPYAFQVSIPSAILPIDPSFAPGQSLRVYIMPAHARPLATIDKKPCTALFVDVASNYCYTFSAASASPSLLLDHLIDWQTNSRVRFHTITLPDEYICEPIISWCAGNFAPGCPPVVLQSSSPVPTPSPSQVLHDAYLVNNARAGTSHYLITHGYHHVCEHHNRRPQSSGESPLDRWPSAPFAHPSLPLGVWGCVAFGWVCKKTDNPNTKPRANAGIYLGHSRSCGHLLYHQDQDRIQCYAYITFDAKVFPFLNQMIAQDHASASAASGNPVTRAHLAQLVSLQHPHLPPFVPLSIEEALAHVTAPLWRAAITDAMDRQSANWVPIRVSDIPHGSRIDFSSLSLSTSVDYGPTAHLVVDPVLHLPDNQDPVVLRTLLALAAEQGWDLQQVILPPTPMTALDLAASPGRYVWPPESYSCAPDTAMRILHPLPGLVHDHLHRQASIDAFLLTRGFSATHAHPALWVHHHHQLNNSMLVFHHDHHLLFLYTDRSASSRLAHSLAATLHGAHQHNVSTFLDIDLSITDAAISLSQAPFVHSILTASAMLQCRRAAVPLESSCDLSHSHSPTVPDTALHLRYRRIVRQIAHLAAWTRPDLAFATSRLSEYLINPGETHMTAALHVLRFLKGTPSRALIYTRGLPNPLQLTSWADADWAACTDTRRSVSGRVTSLHGGAVDWGAIRQPTVATSTAEAEFLSANVSSKVIEWLLSVLDALRVPRGRPVPMYEDNRACRMMSESRAVRDRTKHIDYSANNLRGQVSRGVLQLFDCPTHDMVADSMTKNLPAPAFLRHSDIQMGATRHSSPALPRWPPIWTPDQPAPSLQAYLRRL